MSQTPSPRTATTDGPPTSGSQTRAGQRPAVPSFGSVACRRHVICYARHAFLLLRLS